MGKSDVAKMEERLKNLELTEAKKIKKFGFITHFVTDNDETSPTGHNVHTHGLEQFGHLDFQIVIPMDNSGRMAHNIFRNLVDKIKDGQKFQAGKCYPNIIANYDVSFILAAENGREILRVILPDTEGNLNKEDIHERFAIQYSEETIVH